MFIEPVQTHKQGKSAILFQIIDVRISWAPVADGNGGTMAQWLLLAALICIVTSVINI